MTEQDKDLARLRFDLLTRQIYTFGVAVQTNLDEERANLVLNTLIRDTCATIYMCRNTGLVIMEGGMPESLHELYQKVATRINQSLAYMHQFDGYPLTLHLAKKELSVAEAAEDMVAYLVDADAIYTNRINER